MLRYIQRCLPWHRLPFSVQQQTCPRFASTVYALSSGQGKCGVAVLRVTGERARDVFTNMTMPATLPPARVATLRKIFHPVTREGLDRGLVLWFPGPYSFTGEDSCELHIHGGPAVIAAVLIALSTLPGYQPAQPGDFTKRAFYNEKLDLTSVEGLGDLIHAETEAQRRQALRQMEGALAELYTRWRQILLYCRASLEAYIDFSEDDNIKESVVAEVENKICKLIQELEQHLMDNRRGEKLRSGLHMAILGKPNVGKSSFLNILTQRPAAIVSPIPGTTRDVVETSLDLGGYPVIISDTAGLRQTDDIVEIEGVKRALTKARQSDIAVIILEAPEVLPLVKCESFSWDTFFSDYLKEIEIYNCDEVDTRNNFVDESFNWIRNKDHITLINKMDLIDCVEDRDLLVKVLKDSCVLLSLKTQEGIETSLHKLKDLCASLCEMGTAENPTLTAARHRTHISACLKSLKIIIGSDYNIQTNMNLCRKHRGSKKDLEPQTINFSHQSFCSNKVTTFIDNHSFSKTVNQQHFQDEASDDDESINLLRSEETIVVAAHYLHIATTSLSHITGQITTEDILSHIFMSFCIGK
ncbi:tRNA modification GTPase GTPBP3, mitochondrial-like [Homarus americanus]|uniref:tRNA modification GTPase GTPBP3, mitochondrial-like n=1 Tax=Homarus americanus TaxID=6706 RepID=UPI001C442FCC|nr:tRNA modification GTPase GTPBP3, mitochondrial-like [Homarus americanus]